MPMNFAMLVVIWIFSGFISKPLKVLARNVKKMTLRSTIERVENLNAWYYEAQQLKQAFLLGLENIHDKVDKLQHDADIDPLTGLNNRRLLEQILDTFLVTNTSFCAITFDIDHFKKVNDSYGHSAGDQVLKELARIVLDSSRGNDVSIRLGGEEFLILMANCKLEVAVKIAERLRTTVMQHDFPGVGSVTISLGVAAWPEHGLSPHDTLRIADERLYRAKNQGRNKVCSTEK
jgi:diguanylate cyclase (GGDEF)-like protein